MNQVRIYGDPFGDDSVASLLRSFLRLALGSGVRCSLSLAAVRAGEPEPNQRVVPLTDGVRDLRVGTHLPSAEIDLLMRAAGEVVAATAPVLVFASPQQRADAVRAAGLTWPRATAVLPTRDGAVAADLLERVRAELRWSGTENPLHALDERELAPWLTLPVVGADGPIVCVDDGDRASGVDLAIACWRQHFAASGPRLRVVVTSADAAALLPVVQALGEDHPRADVIVSPFEPAHVRDAVAVLLPWRSMSSARTLVLALASGRPVCASRFAATASLLTAAGTCMPIGGRNVPDEPGAAAHFAPLASAITVAVQTATREATAAATMGRRARAFVIEELTRCRPASPPPPVPSMRAQRPTVVLEAPFFETSSSAELSIETARALLRRDRVDVRLVPTLPLRTSLAAFRARAPELECLLSRDPGEVDLWLASGWPVRAARPACRTFALRVDWEYGALPAELTPHVTQDADTVVVHSEHVYRTLTAAGRPMSGIKVIPHGVDAAMNDAAPPDADLVAWKQDLPAVLFCGGMIWRKGFDVFLRAVLSARAAGARFAVVIKTVGHDQHYSGFHLGELLQRFRATKGTPPVRVIDGELSRSQLASVYTACDVLLHPYRGEGFCLPVLEARACGLPVLATKGGATEALMVGPAAVKIPSARRSVELPGAHVGTPWVFEPSADAAAQLLVSALANLPTLRREARTFSRAVRAAFPWEAPAMALEEMAFAAAGKRRVVMPPEPLFTLPQVAVRLDEPVPVSG